MGNSSARADCRARHDVVPPEERTVRAVDSRRPAAEEGSVQERPSEKQRGAGEPGSGRGEERSRGEGDGGKDAVACGEREGGRPGDRAHLPQ